MIVILISLIFFAIGLFILNKSATILIDGAATLAAKLNINPLVIGLTVIAFGTSAPELVVSVTSALNGNTGLAFGNIVGSNIANILLILGISAVIIPLSVQNNTVWKEVPMSFLGAVILLILGLQNILDSGSFSKITNATLDIVGYLTFSNGLILLCFFIIFLYYTFGIIKKSPDNNMPTFHKAPIWQCSARITLGLIGLTIGSKLLVDNAINLARMFEVPDHFIGLTLVAIGTSIPELAANFAAIAKKQVSLAIGNVIGSNIFNIFFVLGITSLFADIPISLEGLSDITILLFATTILFVSFFVMKKMVISRIEGSFMLIAYTFYIIYLFARL